jgi:pimeloyl-ACP methyl ester carboxylesterase
VADAKRVFGVALAQVVHLPGVELDVGTTYACTLHFDDYLTGGGNRPLDLVDPGVGGSVKYQRAHQPSIPFPPAKCDSSVTVAPVTKSDANSELLGLGDLIGLVVDRIASPVEGVHRALADRSLRWTGVGGESTRRMVDTAISTFYSAIRLSGSAVGTSVGLGASVASSRSQPLSESRFGSRVQAAINATWGDDLEQRGSEMSIEMSVRNVGGTPIRISPDAFAASFPDPGVRVVVLVHGLGRTESCWQAKGGQTGLWDLLAADPSRSTVMVRYNTGRHISENGADLARLLDQVWRSWPTPIESISLVGHSMGGLVIRSACHVGQAARQSWVETVDKVVTVGTPHLGAPLEKVANIVSWGLRATPESRPIAEFLDARSVGIKDLRFGAIIEEDWLGKEPDALLRNTVTNIPPLEGVDHHFAAAVVTSDPTHPVGALVGDLMVRAASGTGQGRGRRIEATDIRVLGGRRHFDLIHDAEVLDQVMTWLTNSTPVSVPG